MAEGRSLKEQNAWLIRAAMVGHFLAFVWVTTEPIGLLSADRATLTNQLEAFAAPGTAALGLIVIASLLLLGFIPPIWRDRIMHWRWKDPLPGSRAFSKIGPAAANVDMRKLRTEHGAFPRAGDKQNALFYSIYRSHREDVGVLDAHGRYLAARDIGTITALLSVTLPWLAWWATEELVKSAIYGASLLVIYALCVVASKNYSLRMVQNVLAAASSA
ncbi:hypothetical protein GRI89_15340 [Altererythrobacter salegens]|uniref:Uncharacterized protein n=1 Tax=Croceibacterium salegens TaxID=1737568 RepID=A0A6I4T0X0_9SPHN|nr:hypothetical protein [Croceibacterium salegens]MXO60916.1 hypothetical protein [Croceibacterium salegens]